MSGIDIFIIIVFAYNCIVGISNGLLKSLFGVGAFIIATILAPAFQGMTTNLIQDSLQSNQELTKILGLGLSWFIIYIVLNIVATIIIKGMNKTPLKIFDRIAGLLLGLFMSIVIVVLPLLVLNAIPVLKDIPQVRNSLSKSQLIPLFAPVGKPFEYSVKNALREQREEIMKKLKAKEEEMKKEINKEINKNIDNKANDVRKIMKEVGGGLGKK
ncbi:MAG: CvpA family protein [Candidatus Sericytochromatia bacterium]